MMMRNKPHRFDWRFSLGLLIVILGSAWFLRQTQGFILWEIYYRLTSPFQPNVVEQEKLLNSRTQELQTRIVELEAQNQKLREFLGFITSPGKKSGVVAPVIGRGANHWWNQITIGRGSSEGIDQDFVVMGPGGLIGRVVSVTPHTSQVLLVSDPSSRVGVIVSRTRNMGFVKGKGKKTAVVEFFDHNKIKVGDVVSTSSFSQLFPPGLPIGRLLSIEHKGTSPEGMIEFFAPLDSLEWVIVYPHKKGGINPLPSPSSGGKSPSLPESEPSIDSSKNPSTSPPETQE